MKKKTRFKKKAKMAKRWIVAAVITTLLNIAMVVCLVLAYWSGSSFRDLFIATAYSTGTHQYYANFLYNEQQIFEALKGMAIEEHDEPIDLDDIVVTEVIPTTFSSESEREVLERNPGDVYKVVTLSGSGWKGYMTVIYDPTRISVGTAKNFKKEGQTPSAIAKRYNALVAINSTGFRDWGGVGNGGHPSGSVVVDGKIVYKGHRSSKWGGGIVGFTEEGKLVLTKKTMKKAVEELGVYNAVEFGPFLLVNGQPTKVSKGVGGVQPRTFLGQRADGIVLFFVIDGRQGRSAGITFSAMINLLKKYQVVNAANMDGGASSTLVIKGKVRNNPCAYSGDGQRAIPVIWMVK